MELAVVEWVAWFNDGRLHESLGDRPPVEIEAEFAARNSMVDEANWARTAPAEMADERLLTGLSEAR